MISLDEQQTADILLKWAEDDVNTLCIGVFAESGFLNLHGKLEWLADGTVMFRGGGREVTFNIKGATVRYGEARESHSMMAKNLAPEAMGLDIIFPNEDRLALIEMRDRT